MNRVAEFFHNPLSQSHESMKALDGKINQNQTTCLGIILDGLVENRLLFETSDIELNADFIRAVRDRFEDEMSGNGTVNQDAVKVLAAFNRLIENFAEYFELLSDPSKWFKTIDHQARVDGRASNWRRKGFKKNGAKTGTCETAFFERRKLDHRI